MSEYGGNKGQKVQWMIDNVGPEPSAAIIQQARTEGWLCSGKDGSNGWDDFKTTGLDALWNSLPEPGEVQEDSPPFVVPQSPNYPFDMPGEDVPAFDLGQPAQQQPQVPTPEDFSGKQGRKHNYTIAQKREFIEDLNNRMPQHAVALGGSPNHNQMNAAYSTLYGHLQAGQQQQAQQQGFFGMQPPQPGQPQAHGMPVGQQGMAKEADEPVLNFDQVDPNVPINPPPTSTAVMEAGASNDNKTKRAFSSLRIGMQAMLNQRGSAESINARQNMMADITSFGTPQRYFDAANNVFLCLTGRTKPGVGQVVRTQIEAGQGPQDLRAIATPGFTTFIVCQGADYSTPPIEQYGCYPMLARDLIGDNPPQTINAIELQGDGNARFVIQLPMSHEGGGSGPNDPRRETRLNVCFFMNPDELQDLMEQGLFHHLEYYSENFMPTFLQRYNILRQGAGNFRAQVGAMMRAILETFTQTPAFSAYAAVQQGNPDAMYLYMAFKFYATKIMELTNELTALNTKMVSQVITQDLLRTQETLYRKLVDLIYEMDVWNFIIQTVPEGRTQLDVGFWNFSAFGISRALIAGQEALASYKNRTKPWSCYPRFMYQTFFQLQQVEQQQEITNQQLNQAVDAAVARFNASNPSALDLIRFGNTQSVLRYAFLNRDDVRNLPPQQKLQMLTETYANKEQTVGQAMIAQNASNSRLAGFIARAAGMTPATFLQVTGQQKSALRAQSYIQELEEQRRRRIPAFNINDIVQLPNQQQISQIESTVEAQQFRIGMSVASQAANPRIIIKNANNQGQHITYTYKRLDPQGREVGDDQEIREYNLLGAKENVAKANQNLVVRAINAMPGQGGANAGLTPQDAARILGARNFEQSDLSVDVDVAFYQATLEEINNRELFDSDGNATAAARRADGVTLMMAEQLRAQREEMQQQLEVLRNNAQLAALTQPQGQPYWSDLNWQQEYYYQKYLLYKKKFKALQKSWNILASLDQIRREDNGDRPPLPIWERMTVGQVGQTVSQSGPLSVPIRVINTGWCLAAFDLATRVGLPASLANMAQQLRTTVFGSTQTLAQTWNNGRLLSFGEWATIDSELSNRAQTEAARNGQLLTAYDQAWYNEYVAMKELEKQRAQDRQVNLVVLGGDVGRKAEETEDEGGERGAARRRGNQDANNNQAGNQGGGRRKKKTKSKYNKMGGRKKKTRKKRGGKNKSRKKRGGETDLTKEQCKNEFRKHKICGDGKKKQYLKFSRTNHPDRNPEDGGAAFQTLNSCLGQHWEGEMNKLNEDNFGCEAKAEMVGTQEGHNVPTKKVETKEGYKATNETHLGCRKAVTDGGQEYWYNKHHETTYNKNSEVCGGTDKELRLQNKKLDEKFEECDTAITPAGEKYYYNRNTKARTYDKDDGTCKTEQQLSVPCNSKKDCQEGQICYGEKGAKVCGTVEDAKAAGKAKGEKRRAEAAEAAAAAQDVDLSSLPKSEEEKATQQETVAPQTGDIDPVQKEEEPAINPQQATESQQTGDITPVQKEEEPAINPQQGEKISKEELEETINKLSPELQNELKKTQAKFKNMSQEQIQQAFNKTTEDLFKNLAGQQGGRKKRKKAKRKTKRKTKRKKSKKRKRRTRRRR